jgi:NADH:ubiquinone oxidoreductase subunit 4 (subunit M)
MRPRPDDAAPVVSTSGWTRSVIAAAAVLILILGILPNSVVRWTQKSTDAVPVAVR